MGGGVGWHLLGAAPHRLNRAVLLAPIPSGGVPTGAIPSPQHARTHPLQYYGYLPVPSRRDVLERLAIVDEGRARDTDAWRQQRAAAVAACSDEYWIEGWRSIVEFRAPEPLESLRTPVRVLRLIVWTALEGVG